MNALPPLLKTQAGADTANFRSATPLDVARREGHGGVVAYLEAQGAVARQPIAEPSGPYLGQTLPGMTPSLFAPALVSTERRELNAAFTPDGPTLFFARDRYPRGTVIMALADDGLLSLDDEVKKYLPRFDGNKAAITIRQLLSHTSGLPPSHPVLDNREITLAQAVDRIADVPLVSKPGQECLYGDLAILTGWSTGRRRCSRNSGVFPG